MRSKRFHLVGLYCLFHLAVYRVESEGSGNNDLSLLMIGNSFSMDNDVKEMILALFQERGLSIQKDKTFFRGGAVWKEQAEDPMVRQSLAKRQPAWTWVVLQEQSQTPGFYPPSWRQAELLYNASRDAVLQIADAATTSSSNGIINQHLTNTTIILLETWGYLENDPMNPSFYTDYPAMQKRVSRGYEFYQEAILQRHPNAQVRMAPVGRAFDILFDQSKAAGQNPLQHNSWFEQLYSRMDDPRRHASLAGSYLAACVLFQTMSGLDVRRSKLSPPAPNHYHGAQTTIDKELQQRLRQVAYQAVQDYYRDFPQRQPSAPFIATKRSSSNDAMAVLPFSVLLAVAMVLFVLQRRRRQNATGGHHQNPASRMAQKENDDEEEDVPLLDGNDGGLAVEMARVFQQGKTNGRHACRSRKRWIVSAGRLGSCHIVLENRTTLASNFSGPLKDDG